MTCIRATSSPRPFEDGLFRVAPVNVHKEPTWHTWITWATPARSNPNFCQAWGNWMVVGI